MSPHHYSKLVRDKIPGIFERSGEKLQYHRAGSDEEYYHKLKLKLQESLDQFCRKETIENFADVIEVVESIRAFKNFDPRDLGAVLENRAIEFGKYNDRVIAEMSELQLGLEQDELI